MSKKIFQTVHILYFAPKSKIDTNERIPLYCRITVNGKRAEFSLNRKVDSTKWISKATKLKGTKEESRNLDNYLNTVTQDLRKLENDFKLNDKLITAVSLRNKYLGRDAIKRTVLSCFKEHNNKMKDLVNVEYSPGTIKRFETTYKHLEQFMIYSYSRNDMYLHELKYKFITDLEQYFKTVRLCNHNSTLKYIRNFRKIINIAVGNDWLDKDPFMNYKVKLKEVIREFLSKEELERIENKEFKTQRLTVVRDIFVFCCYTGLAYADIQKLQRQDIVIGIDKQKWIYTHRKKTQSKSNIPLLPKALIILEKYENDLECITNDKLLPVKSNQRMNEYLKEIADVCEVNKNLTFHIARHTFATTVTLTNGVPIETVSSMLGHKNLRTTQIYAKVIENIVSEDMKKLVTKLNNENSIKKDLIRIAKK